GPRPAAAPRRELPVRGAGAGAAALVPGNLRVGADQRARRRLAPGADPLRPGGDALRGAGGSPVDRAAPARTRDLHRARRGSVGGRLADAAAGGEALRSGAAVDA